MSLKFLTNFDSVRSNLATIRDKIVRMITEFTDFQVQSRLFVRFDFAPSFGSLFFHECLLFVIL